MYRWGKFHSMYRVYYGNGYLSRLAIYQHGSRFLAFVYRAWCYILAVKDQVVYGRFNLTVRPPTTASLSVVLPLHVVLVRGKIDCVSSQANSVRNETFNEER